MPDHLINGLIKNTLIVCFKALDSDARRRAIEKRILGSAKENGLPVTGSILHFSKRGGAYQGLNSVNMTTLICLLLCAAPAFDSEYRRTGMHVFRLARLLQNFSSAVFYWPCTETDGSSSADMLTTSGKIAYYAALREMAMLYLKECDNIMETDESLGTILDKPNAHRAVELAVHTIPAFGHARNCS